MNKAHTLPKRTAVDVKPSCLVAGVGTGGDGNGGAPRRWRSSYSLEKERFQAWADFISVTIRKQQSRFLRQ